MRLFWVVTLALAVMGCTTTYRDFPIDALAQKPTPGSCKVMHYQVKRFDILEVGGYGSLRTIFDNAVVCQEMLPVDRPPDTGLYVEIEAKWKPMSMPALIFNYLSVSTLTLLPAWSGQDGFNVNYHLYVDGERKKTYKYEITRKFGLWLGLLPFSWVNFFTFDEEDAFEGTANQFFIDARPYFVDQAAQVPLMKFSPN